MRKPALLVVAFLAFSFTCRAASVYTTRLEDSQAVYLMAGSGGDASQALQAAIDKVQETTGEGIVFVPEGRYLVTRTIYVWPGIRVIGYGAQRPVFVLPPNTPGFAQGIGYMFFYAGGRPAAMGGRHTIRAAIPFHPLLWPQGTVPLNHEVSDANPGTFYSAMSNVDFEIGAGNPAAVAIRFHVAQHGYLAHMDFHIGSGLAALNDIGNEGEDLHFYGGRYGILTRKPSPAWQFTLLDSTFDGQREAAIRENEAGLTLVHDDFKNAPTGIAIDAHYSDQLWVKDSRFENMGGPAVIISNEDSRLTQINFEEITCRDVPIFARFRESSRQFAGSGSIYQVKVFAHGLTLPGIGGDGSIETVYQPSRLSTMPPFGANVIPALPPTSTWVNLQSLGAKGDAKTDDSAAIRKAIADHPVLYIPSGHYMVSDTIELRPDTVLIGLHPDNTQLDILDSTAGFQGPGAPRALLEAPAGGANIVTGIGLFTGGINSRAVGALWKAGKDSLMDDVRFLGGHGTNGLDGKRINPYNANHTADPDIHRRWDAQYPSLWITDNGGGTFANIWTPDTFAQAGLYVSRTSTPGHVYELSSEHHVRNEIKLDQVSNWELYALQTEEESGEGPFASSLEITDSSNLTIANYHGYRVVRSYQPFPYAIRLSRSHDIHFRNIHVDSNSAIAQCDAQGVCRQFVRASKVSYDNSIVDQTDHAEVREREFAWLDAPGHVTPVTTDPRVKQLATGFFNISGGAVDDAGHLYFTDAYRQRIYQWSPETKEALLVRDNSLDPVNLAFDKSGDLIVISSAGKGETVYCFRPGAPEDQFTILDPEPAADRPGMTAVLPPSYWVNGDFTNTLSPATYQYESLDQMFTRLVSTWRPYQYISPDHSIFIPANQVLVQGEPYYGSKWSYILESFGLVKAAPGQTVYVTNESDQKTYSAELKADGTLSNLKLFTNRGGESLAQDAAGNVYLAAGQVYVYNRSGRLIDTIRVTERPNQILFGGRAGHTLFIFTHHTLYAAVRPR